MGSGSGSEPVRTTEPAIFISKNRKNIERGRKLIENDRRGGTRSGELCLSELWREIYGPDGKHSSVLGELRMFLAREHCSFQSCVGHVQSKER